MYIEIRPDIVIDSHGRTIGVHVDVMITHTPREGFDNEKLGELERDMKNMLKFRLNDAIKKGGENEPRD